MRALLNVEQFFKSNQSNLKLWTRFGIATILKKPKEESTLRRKHHYRIKVRQSESRNRLALYIFIWSTMLSLFTLNQVLKLNEDIGCMTCSTKKVNTDSHDWFTSYVICEKKKEKKKKVKATEEEIIKCLISWRFPVALQWKFLLKYKGTVKIFMGTIPTWVKISIYISIPTQVRLYESPS